MGASVQVALVQALQDRHLPALATIPAAWLLAYVPHFVKMGLIVRADGDYEITAPRASYGPEITRSFGKYTALVRRCAACHENAFESFAPFALAVILCKVKKADPATARRFALRYL